MLESFGISPPDWLAYGPLPISICMALSYFPFAFLLFSSALSKIDIQLEEVASTLGAKTKVIWSRASSILPQFVGKTFLIHNGKKFIPITVSEDMVGHKFGEFAPTRQFFGHTPADKKAKPATAEKK